MIGWYIVGAIVCIAAGFGLAFYVIGRDKTIVKIADDEQIVKKPRDGLTLVAVPPDVLRRFVVQRETPGTTTDVEARDIYRTMKLETEKK